LTWIRSGTGLDALKASTEQVESAKFASILSLWSPDAISRLDRIREFFYYDPVPQLEKLKSPLLAIYGEKDAFVPVEKSVRILRKALQKAGNRDYTPEFFLKRVIVF
jgi:fermentation-respiration switch protein FrsA (DUF1100 family)